MNYTRTVFTDHALEKAFTLFHIKEPKDLWSMYDSATPVPAKSMGKYLKYEGKTKYKASKKFIFALQERNDIEVVITMYRKTGYTPKTKYPEVSKAKKFIERFRGNETKNLPNLPTTLYA